MRITYSYGLVGETAERKITARRSSVHAAEAHFGIGLVGDFARGDVAVTVLDWILWHAHLRALARGDADGAIGIPWEEFAEGETEGALDWAVVEDMTSGNPHSSGE